MVTLSSGVKLDGPGSNSWLLGGAPIDPMHHRREVVAQIHCQRRDCPRTNDEAASDGSPHPNSCEPRDTPISRCSDYLRTGLAFMMAMPKVAPKQAAAQWCPQESLHDRGSGGLIHTRKC